jgi:hypothetical protein
VTIFTATWPDGYRTKWRNLTWREFRKLSPLFKSFFIPEEERNEATSPMLSPMDLFLEVYKTCLLEGPDPVIAPAGIVDWIGRQQIRHNPFAGAYKDLANMVQAARELVAGDYLLTIKGIIASALHYTMSEIDEMDADELFVRLAQTELIVGCPIQPEDPNPKEPPRQKKPSARELARRRVMERDKTK